MLAGKQYGPRIEIPSLSRMCFLRWNRYFKKSITKNIFGATAKLISTIFDSGLLIS